MAGRVRGRSERVIAAWIVASSALAVACGGNATPSGPGESYEQLTLEISGGYGPVPCSNSKDSYQLTRSSGHLSWLGCDYRKNPAEPVMGERSLSAAEVETVNQALDKVSASSAKNCGADASVLTLDVTHDSSVERYADDFYSACPWEVHAGRTFVTGLGDLASVLSDLAKR